MFTAGTIDKETMRTFDDDCLVIPRELTPDEIKALRENKPCQPAGFCRLSEHEPVDGSEMGNGAKRPSGPALKHLSLVQKHGLQMLA